MSDEETHPVLAAWNAVAEALPDDEALAFEALTYAIVDLAASARIARKDVHANIDRIMDARHEAARQVMQ